MNVELTPMPDPGIPALYRMQVTDLASYAMFVISPDGRLVSWNTGVQRLLGFPEAEWIGRHASIIFTPSDKAMEVCNSELRLAAESGSAADIRWHRRQDGTELFAHGSMNAVRDASGTLVGYTKILSDETARKELQDSLTESNAALEQFAYVASHDLQEPLRTMSMHAQLLRDKFRDKVDSQTEPFLNSIISASGRMTALINDLLAYARITTEDNRPSSIALDEDLEAAITQLGQAIQESGAVITHDPLPVLRVDRGQMVRLFQNLLGNAIKYRNAGQPPKVHVSAKEAGKDWIISVRDNGIGFDPAHASSIFTPFKRLHTATEYPGTGVGLAICRRIVQAQGGQIWAESRPGEGATFLFTLPVSGPPLPHTTAPINNPR